jgi:hypothetical protein
LQSITYASHEDDFTFSGIFPGRKTKEKTMLKIITTASALALAAAVPAMAQDTMQQPAGPTPSGGTMQPSTPPASEPAPSTAPAPQSGAPTATDPAAPAAPAADSGADKSAAVAQVVEAEFPTYDADKSTDLTKSEFTKWVSVLKAKSDAAQGKADKMAAADMTKWANDAFASADADKSKKVSKDEMIKFLQG